MRKHTGARHEGIQVPSRGVNTAEEPGADSVSRSSLAAATSVIMSHRWQLSHYSSRAGRQLTEAVEATAENTQSG